MRTLQGLRCLRLIVAGSIEIFETYRVPDDGLQIVDCKAGNLQIVLNPGNSYVA